jgi:BolA protein
MGPTATAMREILERCLTPTLLTIVDDSARHAGHAGASNEGESHFNLTIEAEAFRGMGRVDRQRLVHKLLEDHLRGPVHALSLRLKAPGEP